MSGSARHHEVLIIVEEGAVGGFASHVLAHLANSGALESRLKVRTLQMPDRFLDHDRPEAMLTSARQDKFGLAAYCDQ